MSAWLSIALGIVGGAVVIVGAVYLAFRPYLAVKAPRGWMPEATGRDIGENYTGDGGMPGADGF